jgi:hypothetical protein
MSAELIREHFVHYLGVDVAVSFNDPEDPRDVILYRPDRLSEGFVTWAFEALETTAPGVAWNIDRLLVAYETPLGRTQRGVEIFSHGRPRHSAKREIYVGIDRSRQAV